jgi:pimeloyl-ACP methyl ester carboxylesterase
VASRAGGPEGANRRPRVPGPGSRVPDRRPEPEASPSLEPVVLVHGLWMTGLEMGVLARRLGASGFRTLRFPYSTARSGMTDNVVLLREFMRKHEAPVMHICAHSLGGVVVMGLLRAYEDLPPGRVVLLGSPVRGSHAARRLAGSRIGALMLGRAHEPEFLVGGPPWHGGRELGIIGGTFPAGLAMLLGGLPKPHDGTIALEETRLGGPAHHLSLPVSHLGMLLSREVARQVGHFLKHAEFQR